MKPFSLWSSFSQSVALAGLKESRVMYQKSCAERIHAKTDLFIETNCNVSVYQTPYNEETVNKKGAVVYMFIHYGQNYPLITFYNLPFILI